MIGHVRKNSSTLDLDMESAFRKVPVKILIIDNDEEGTRILSRLIELNFGKPKLIVTESGKKGIELAKRDKPDVIILGITLPDMNGFDVLKTIRSFSNMPVLIVTAWADKSYQDKARELRATEYIVKPFSQADLLKKLRAALPSENPV